MLAVKKKGNCGELIKPNVRMIVRFPLGQRSDGGEKAGLRSGDLPAHGFFLPWLVLLVLCNCKDPNLKRADSDILA